MDTDQLFIETVNDLQQRVYAPASEYDLLVASSLMRKLLLEGAALLHLANRSRRLKFSFEVVDDRAYREVILADRPLIYGVLEGIDPKQNIIPSLRTTLKLDLKQFLTWPAMYLAGEDISVKDLVLQAANVEGGVHIGQPTDGTRKVLHDLNNRLRVGNCPAATRSLKGIGGVIVTAVQPLRQAIE